MIKKILKKTGLDNTFIGRNYDKYIGPLIRKRNKRNFLKSRKPAMDKYGVEALGKLYKCCQKFNVPIWFEFGTMLGAIREHGFIAHDFDIDTGMYYKDYSNRLERALFDEGFSIKREFRLVENEDVDNKTRTEITLFYKGVFIDIFFSFIDGDIRYNYSYCSPKDKDLISKNYFCAKKYDYPLADMKEIDFLGIKFMIPSNADVCMKHTYGDNYMKPDPNFIHYAKWDLPYPQYYGEMIGSWI